MTIENLRVNCIKFFQEYNRNGIKVNELTLNSHGTTVGKKI